MHTKKLRGLWQKNLAAIPKGKSPLMNPTKHQCRKTKWKIPSIWYLGTEFHGTLYVTMDGEK